jgi:hypothetical protein
MYYLSLWVLLGESQVRKGIQTWLVNQVNS